MKSRLGHVYNSFYPLEFDMVTVVLQVCDREQGLKGNYSGGDDNCIYTLPF